MKTRFWLALTLAFVTVSCAGKLSLKQTGVASLTSVDSALSRLQDYERANVATLHLDTAAAPTLTSVCPPMRQDGTPVATPTKHQVFACLFRKAFTEEARAARALETYKPGDPVPADLVTLQADIAAGIQAVKVLLPSATDFLSALQAVSDAALQVIGQIKAAITTVASIHAAGARPIGRS